MPFEHPKSRPTRQLQQPPRKANMMSSNESEGSEDEEDDASLGQADDITDAAMQHVFSKQSSLAAAQPHTVKNKKSSSVSNKRQPGFGLKAKQPVQ